MPHIGTPPVAGFKTTTKQSFSGDNSTTAFTLNRASSTATDLEVFVDNIQQEPTTAYSVSGTTLTFTEAPPTGTNNVYVVNRGGDQNGLLPPQDLGTTDYIFGDDVSFNSDGAVINMGADSEIKITHVADTGVKLTDSGGTPTLQLHDANESVSSDGSKLILTSNGVAFSLPTADGTSNQVLQTNGSGVLSFATVDTSGATDSFAITGSTPTLTIGDAGAEDTKIVFDGNAQDYHIGLDDNDDDLKIGKGSALGTTTWMSFDENGVIYVKSDGGNVTTEVTQGLAKMWIQFNGTGTIATADSLNTSSVTDNAVGHYQINIGNDMSNDDFSVANALSRIDGSGSGQLMALPGTSTGAGIVAMYNQNTSATNIDTTQVYAVVHGDLA